MSHPARGVWIETLRRAIIGLEMRSHPARGVWIETSSFSTMNETASVTPRTGCVD